MISALYAIFSFLEDTGYLARVAYLMDSFLSGLGIDGKSAIPLMMGFLCNTVSIAGSRVVDSPRRRLITLCMLPFIPCSGQMGVAFLFAFALFPAGTALLVVLGVSCLNLFMAGAVGRIMHATLPGRYANGLIMELPLYHRPNFRTIFGNVRTRAVLFLRGAAVNIFAALIVVWAISTFPGGTVETSWLYRFGRWLEPLGSFLGFDWRFTVALLSSFVAKETTAGRWRSCSPWARPTMRPSCRLCGLPSPRRERWPSSWLPTCTFRASPPSASCAVNWGAGAGRWRCWQPCSPWRWAWRARSII